MHFILGVTLAVICYAISIILIYVRYYCDKNVHEEGEAHKGSALIILIHDKKKKKKRGRGIFAGHDLLSICLSVIRARTTTSEGFSTLDFTGQQDKDQRI